MYGNCKLITGQWIRFSGFFQTRTAETLTLKLQTEVNSTVINFDDLSITESPPTGYRTTGIYFEPGFYGKRLQVPIGEVLSIQDYVNRFASTIIAKYKPYFINQQGSACIFSVGTNPLNMVSARQESDNTGNYFSGLHAQDFDLYSTKITSSIVDNILDFHSTGKGLIELAIKTNAKYASAQNLFSLFLSRLYQVGIGNQKYPFSQTKEIEYPINYAGSKTFDRICLGDVGAWEGFWIVNYDMSDEETIAEMLADSTPINNNKSMLFSINIPTNGYALIDCEENTVEYTPDGSLPLINGMNYVTGDVPEIKDGVGVLFSDTNISGLQVIGRMVK